MSVEQWWISKTFVADWKLTNLTTGLFVPGAAVTGTIALPSGGTAAMTVTELADRYRATYDTTMSGRHGFRLVATGAADSAEEGTFTVNRSVSGAAPITVDPTTDLGMVRTLVTDLDEAFPFFTDAQLTAFLMLEASNVRLAAATALETLASSEAMVSKKIRTNDLQTDGPAVAKELRERATALREQAAGYGADGSVFAFDVVDFDPTSWLLTET